MPPYAPGGRGVFGVQLQRQAAAANFDGEQLARAVQYAHFHRVRVHVTVNTLVKEGELEAVYAALGTIAQARADAVIVQDLGVAALAKEHFPTLDLHASTQMALHNATGVRWAKGLGFDRVVLARECTWRKSLKRRARGWRWRCSSMGRCAPASAANA